MNNEKSWYVVQVYTGYEDAVKQDLERVIVTEGAQGLFGEVLVPTGKASSVLEDEEEKREKIFPGYVLVQMSKSPEAFRIVNSLSRVAKFLGGVDATPISQNEVDRIFAQMRGKIAVQPEKALFMVGNEITIESGPFAGFVGIVENIDEDRKRLTVNVSIFGRLTPVELGFEQVEK